MHVPLVGLTGGIASGKSSVARILTAKGVPSVDADALSRQVVEPGSEGLRAVTRAFGAEVLAPDGALHRARLAALVFSDAAQRARLESILHPRIARLADRRVAELAATSPAYIVYEAALLVERSRQRDLDALVLVASSQANQIARIVERDGLSPAEAKERIAAQLPLEDKLKLADYVIHNDGSWEELDHQTRAVHDALTARFEAKRRAQTEGMKAAPSHGTQHAPAQHPGAQHGEAACSEAGRHPETERDE